MIMQEYFVFQHCCAGIGIPVASTSNQVSIGLKQCSSMNLQNRAVLPVKESTLLESHQPCQDFTNWKKTGFVQRQQDLTRYSKQ